MKYLFLLLFLLFAGALTVSADVPKHEYSHRQAARASRRIAAHHAQILRKTRHWLKHRKSPR